MYLRRKIAEHGRVKRHVKKSKFSEIMSSSYAQYVKLLIIWILLLMMDFMGEFRFEFFWPCWLLFRSLHDSFKYQGFVFSVFFLCITLVSDTICYFFIPATWLFFLANTYIWFQLIMNTEQGVGLPTVTLFFLFMYIEFAVRLREPKNITFNIDLCRPFASHCIGYPVVTLGFCFKSYVSYRFRLRKQKGVQAQNSIYFTMLDDALPEECRQKSIYLTELPDDQNSNSLPSNGKSKHLLDSLGEDLDDQHSDSGSSHSLLASSGDTPANFSPSTCLSRTPPASGLRKALPSILGVLTSSSKCNGSTATSQPVSTTSTTTTSSTASKKSCSPGSVASMMSATCVSSVASGLGSPVSHLSSSYSLASSTGQPEEDTFLQEHLSSLSLPTGSASGLTSASCLQGSAKSKSSKGSESINKLEGDLKRLKSDLQSSRHSEGELRSQLSQTSQLERRTRTELEETRREKEELETRVSDLVTRYQAEKRKTGLQEKRISEEKKLRQASDALLAAERKARREENKDKENYKSSECDRDKCRQRRQELEEDVVTLKRQLVHYQTLSNKATHHNNSTLDGLLVDKAKQQASLVSAETLTLRDENSQLNRTLKEENRIKQDLLAAYHGAMKEVSHLNSTLTEKEYELVNLNMKLNELSSTLSSGLIHQHSNTPPQGLQNTPCTSGGSAFMGHRGNTASPGSLHDHFHNPFQQSSFFSTQNTNNNGGSNVLNGLYHSADTSGQSSFSSDFHLSYQQHHPNMMMDGPMTSQGMAVTSQNNQQY